MRVSQFGMMKQSCEIEVIPSTRESEPVSIIEGKRHETKATITEYSVFLTVSLISLSAGFVSQMTASMLDYWAFYDNSTLNPNLLAILDLEPSASSIAGSFILSLIASILGRKAALYLAAVTGIISGILFAYDEGAIICIIIARAFASVIMTAAYMVCPLYMIEVIHDSTRGFFTAGCSFMIFGGMTTAFALERVISYPIVCAFLWILPTTFLFLFFWLPESPYFLASKGKSLRAERSLVWMRRQDPDRVKPELDVIIELVESDTGPCCTLKNDSSAGMATALSLYILKATGGIAVTRHICDLVCSNQRISVRDMHGIILTLNVISSFIGLLAVDRAGRKMLLYISYGGSSLSFLLITVCLYVKTDILHSVPLFCLCVFAIFYGLGYGTITPLLALELTPPRSRCRMMAVAILLESILSMCILVSHQPINIVLGRSVNYIIPTIGNALGVLFVWMVLSETSCKTLKDIQQIQIS